MDTSAVRDIPAGRGLSGALAAVAANPSMLSVHRPPGMSREEIAERILTTLLASSGPIYIAVTGTGGSSYDEAVLATLRGVARRAGGGPAAAVSIPYDNSNTAIVRRTLGLDGRGDEQTLALVLRGLAARAPGRPVYVVAQSQGSWVVSKVLKDDPVAARAIHRAVLFSRPAVAPAVDAWTGAGKVLEIAHTDDIVTGLVSDLNPEMLHSLRAAVGNWMQGRAWQYYPHGYLPDAKLAAAFLGSGSLPLLHPVRHHSSTHRH